jgi:hypothetical protein
MIGTAPKPKEEILSALNRYDKIVVIGCNGCAKACKTGGEAEVAATANELRNDGKK